MNTQINHLPSVKFDAENDGFVLMNDLKSFLKTRSENINIY